MTLPAVHLLFLLFSMLPLLQASPCPRGEYCPEGADCRADKNLCLPATCDNGANRTLCDRDIVVGFTLPIIIVPEDNGLVEPMLKISRPLYCCPISVRVLIEDVTTTANRDYTYPRGGVVQVVFRPGSQVASFQIKLGNDRISEKTEIFRVTIIEVSVPDGVTTLGGFNNAEIYITDDDPACVSIQRPSYSVRENSPSLRVAVVLDIVASYPIDVIVDSFKASATSGCDFDPKPYAVHIKPGDTQAYFDVNINDDDIYEGTESFSIAINSFLPDHVRRCGTYSSVITILDDEREISVRFDKSSYTVNESEGTVVPVLKLDQPSPCCITVYAELTSGTRSSDATGGGIDYGYNPPKKYKFKFNAGETCSTPSEPIQIVDDIISERDERFTISIMEYSIPYGVRISSKSATITIKDNDIAVCFDKQEYEINENDGPLELKLKLDETLKEDTVIQIFDTPNSAFRTTDYSPGPYNVTIKKYNRESEKFFIGIVSNDDERYTGNQNFTLNIDINALNSGLVPCVDKPSTVVDIVDNEYVVCFDKPYIEVTEGENVDLYVSVSRQLSRTISVKLIYKDAPINSATRNNDYIPRTSVSIRSGSVKVAIYTKSDKTVERDETFFIQIDPSILPVGIFNCITSVQVVILNDDKTTLSFEYPNYPRSIRNFDKSELIKPVIVVDNPIPFSIEVTIQAEDGTAVAGEDYKVKYTNPITIYPEDRSKKTIFVDAINDDRVEILQEYLTLRIIDINDTNVYIDKVKNSTKLTIVDDDVCKLTIIQKQLDFSKAIFEDVPVQILYTGSSIPIIDTLAKTETSVDLITARNGIEEIKVCIPDLLYNERSRRVITDDTEKIKIVPRQSC